jgi:lysyl-tRNA synthetase class 2
LREEECHVSETAPQAPSASPDEDVDLPEQMRIRREKLDRIVAEGGQAYPVGYPRTVSVAELRQRFPDLPPGAATGETVAITGRVMLNRNTGKLCFATLQEWDAQVQVMLSLDRVGVDRLAAWKSDVDLGDQVGVTGEVITSRRGELSVLADSWTLTSKALRPFPDKHRGLTDPESRVRQRYVDLVVNSDARQMLETRAAVVAALRSSLGRRGFLEVETPQLQPLHGGAAARPFVTHMNALDIDLYLRIAIELYLKRLLVGGIPKVFEIGRNFRNEGVDATHNPEFTMLEAYEAYSDYDALGAQVREWVIEAAEAVGSTVVPDGAGGEVDLSAEWRSATVHDLVSEALGEEVTPDTSVEKLIAHAAQTSVELQPQWSAGEIVLELYEKLVEHTLRAPTFVRDYPAEVRPLARAHRTDPRLAEASDIVIAGRELAPIYSELIDPIEQRRRLTEQSLRAAGGDPEAMQLDEDFLRALEYGMPPTGGMGMGVDRLVMLLTGRHSIRETVLFPLVRRQ